MAAIELHIDLSTLVDAVVSGNRTEIVAVARELLQQGRAADVLIGRIGLIAAQGDPDGHPTITLTAAAMLSRMLHFMPAPPDSAEPPRERALPLLAQALFAAIPAVQAGNTAQITYPEPFFPSALVGSDKTVDDVMREAVAQNDVVLAERVLLGLFGTGADYRTMEVRSYDPLTTIFQDNGHPLQFAVRGFQLLDTVEWGDRAPVIIHWLAPHLPLRPQSNEPAWINQVRAYAAEPAHDLKSIRTRLTAPKDTEALAVRPVIQSEADTTQVCQAVYDALIRGGASPLGVASVIALAAAETLQKVNEADQETFARIAHGLLYAAATRVIFQRVQDVEVLPILFTAASYINVLYKEASAAKSQGAATATAHAAPTTIPGGGLIASTQLAALVAQLKANDMHAATLTAERYINIGHDPRALFGAIGLVAAQIATTSDQGLTLQVVQAAAEEFLAWPTALAATSRDVFLQLALRTAVRGQRDDLIANL